MKLFTVVSEIVVGGKKEHSFLYGPAESPDDAADRVAEQLVLSEPAISFIKHLAIEAVPDDMIRTVAAALEPQPCENAPRAATKLDVDAEILAALEAAKKTGAESTEADDRHEAAINSLSNAILRHYPRVTGGDRISLGGRLFGVFSNGPGELWLDEFSPTVERGAV